MGGTRSFLRSPSLMCCLPQAQLLQYLIIYAEQPEGLHQKILQLWRMLQSGTEANSGW